MENDRLENIKGILGIDERIENNENNISQVEEIKDKNGIQRKIIRDLGNGRKSIEITRLNNNNNNYNKGI